MTDKELVLEARGGNVEAFSKLVQKYANAVYGVAYHSIGDFHRAQDIAQEVFLSAYLRLDTIDDPNKVSSWLYSITKHQCLMWLRSNSKWESQCLETSFENVELPDVGAKVDVWNALSNLPDQTRLLVILHYISGFKIRELADFVGTSAKAVTNRLYRARSILKKDLLDGEDDSIYPIKLGEDFDGKITNMIDAYFRVLAVGKQEEALKIIEHAVKLDPGNNSFRRLLAYSLSEVGARPGMSALLNKAEELLLELVTTDTNIYHQLGHIYMRQHNYDRAIKCFEKLLDYRPDASISIAQAYLHKKNYAEAKKGFQIAAFRGMQKVVYGLFGLYNTVRGMGDYDSAYRVISILINTLNGFGDEKLYRHDLWKAYIQLARLQLNKEEYDKSVESLKLAWRYAQLATSGASNTLYDELELGLPGRSEEGTDLDWFVKELVSERFNKLNGNEYYNNLVSEAKEICRQFKG